MTAYLRHGNPFLNLARIGKPFSDHNITQPADLRVAPTGNLTASTGTRTINSALRRTRVPVVFEI